MEQLHESNNPLPREQSKSIKKGGGSFFVISLINESGKDNALLFILMLRL